MKDFSHPNVIRLLGIPRNVGLEARGALSHSVYWETSREETCTLGVTPTYFMTWGFHLKGFSLRLHFLRLVVKTGRNLTPEFGF